jgi:ATP-dependent DNA helicase RecQ
MALSGVARSKGRFGRQVIVQMLCGSQSSKIRKWKLDQLSTFGLLAELTQLEANELFDAMFAASMLEQEIVDRYRPTVNLTEYGGEVMRGKAPMRLDLPKDLAAKLERIGRRAARRTDARPENGELQRRPEPTTSTTDPPLDRPIAGRPGFPASAPSHLWTWWLLNSGISGFRCNNALRSDDCPRMS